MSRAERAGIYLAWGLVQAIILAGLLLLGGILGAYVSWDLLPSLFGIRPSAAGLAVGFPGGVILAIWICHSARGWVLRLRVRQLGRDGVAASATVTGLRRLTRRGPRGGYITHYTVQLRWTDPISGGIQHHRLVYRFLTDRSKPFEETCAHGRQLTVRYRAGCPERFVIDIRFAPPMADLIG